MGTKPIFIHDCMSVELVEWLLCVSLPMLSTVTQLPVSPGGYITGAKESSPWVDCLTALAVEPSPIPEHVYTVMLGPRRAMKKMAGWCKFGPTE
jgi:hypothetical protein